MLFARELCAFPDPSNDFSLGRKLLQAYLKACLNFFSSHYRGRESAWGTLFVAQQTNLLILSDFTVERCISGERTPIFKHR